MPIAYSTVRKRVKNERNFCVVFIFRTEINFKLTIFIKNILFALRTNELK